MAKWEKMTSIYYRPAIQNNVPNAKVTNNALFLLSRIPGFNICIRQYGNRIRNPAITKPHQNLIKASGKPMFTFKKSNMPPIIHTILNKINLMINPSVTAPIMFLSVDNKTLF
jgi:hypothetical protein